jgi:hypothetical protein
MKLLLCLTLACASAFAAIGDNAPSIPATYLQTHPRLPYPDNAYLDSLWTARASGAAFVWTDATNWNSAAPGSLIQIRDLLFAYLAEKRHSGPNVATFLGKLQAMQNLGGDWESLLYNVADGVASGTSTFTTTAGNFLTGCSGSTCINNTLAINGSYYKITAIDVTGKILTLSNSNVGCSTQDAYKTGTALSGGVFSLASGCNSPGYWNPALAISLVYDWVFADLGATAQANLRATLEQYSTGFEANYTAAHSSPYNDQFYITGFKQILPMTVAAALYPDDPINTIKILQWTRDMELNMMVPAWKSVVCGDPCIASSGDSDTSHGGGWHEAWGDYANKTEGLTNWYVTEMLSWSTASGITPATFFVTQNPWMKSLAYWTMYQVRPDMLMEPIEPTGRPYFDGEAFSANGNPLATGANPGLLDGLAAIYGDATIRGWSRLVNWYGNTPNGFVPSAWPYYAPDVSGNPTNPRSSLSTVRFFPGRNELFVRTGWGEDDTFVDIQVGSNFWSHPVQNAGNISIFNRGPLAIRSGDYRPGSASDNFQNETAGSISQNTISVYDSTDIYPTETWALDHSDGSATNTSPPNDGGQRRVGSAFSNISGSMSSATSSPSDVAQLHRGREFYYQGMAPIYAVGTANAYIYLGMDITAAYGDVWSRNPFVSAWQYNTANTSNRTERAQKVVRQVLMVPEGTEMLIFVYDQVISINPSFVKKVLWHSINAPAVTGNSFVFTRADLVASKPFPDHWPQQWSSGHVGTGGITHCPAACTTSSTQYQYLGQLQGWMTVPSGGSIATVGGAGAEFQITDSNGAFNHNECMSGQCSTPYGSVAGQAKGPFVISGTNNTLLVTIDGGSAQTITLTSGTRTCAQVIADINGAITGATASCEGGVASQVGLRSNNNTPASSSVLLAAVTNSAYATLLLTTGTYAGSTTDEGFGAIGGFMHPVALDAPHQAGSYRIEESVGAANLSDQFMNVLYASNTSTTTTVGTPTSALTGGLWVTSIVITRTAGTCTVTWSPPQNGMGGNLTATGVGCAASI